MADEVACKEPPEQQQEEPQLTAKQRKNKKKKEAAKKKKQEQRENESNSSSQDCSADTEQKTPQEKFEEELSWCTEQLEIGLMAQKAETRAASLSEQLIRSLKSPKTALPKKRQIMHSVFGDYRKKMVEDMKANGRKEKEPIKAYSVPKDKQQSVFLKTSQNSKATPESASSQEESDKELSTETSSWTFQTSESSFMFNFDEPS